MIKALKYDPYLQTEDFVAWLEGLALEGWFIKGLNQDLLWVNFRKGEAKKVHYAIFTTESSKLFNREEFIEIAKYQGWTLVGNGTHLRELYLFISEEVEPMPLETDPIEIEHKNRKLKRYALWSIGLSVFIVLIYMLPRENGNVFQWFGAIAYTYLGLMHVVQAMRTGFAMDASKQKRDRIAKFVKWIRIAMASGLSLLLIDVVLVSLHFSQIKVENNPLVTWERPTQAEIVNESYAKSRLSLLPNETSMVTIVEEGQLTKSIFQSKQNYLWLSDLAFHERVDKELDWFRYDPVLKYETIKEVALERVMFVSKSGMEYWSFLKQGSTILSLHTINLSFEEHQALLERMEVDL